MAFDKACSVEFNCSVSWREDSGSSLGFTTLPRRHEACASRAKIPMRADESEFEMSLSLSTGSFELFSPRLLG
jgi:hypothetical protein